MNTKEFKVDNEKNNNEKNNFNPDIFNKKMFEVVNPGATYNIPVFGLTKDENKNTKLEIVDAHQINYLRGDKEQKEFMLLGLMQTDKGLKWGYYDNSGEETKMVTFENPEIECIPVRAFLIPEEKVYVLDMVQDGVNTNTKVAPEGVMKKDGTVYTKEEIDKGDLQYDALVYAIELTRFIKGQQGILTESLLEMIIFDLKIKQEEVPSFETFHILNKLKEALMWMKERNADRKRRKVQNTNKQ